MSCDQNLTPEYLKSILKYDPETGIFTWITNKSSAKQGDIAGSLNAKGYLRISINKKSHRNQRLAYFYMNERWPLGDVDHINGVKTDNRWANLREVTKSQNNQNRPKQSNNSSGYKGVSYKKSLDKWRAKIGVNKRVIELGFFDTKEMAYLAYCDAAKKYHKEYNRLF